jgi:pimeloyl-ACP methyl ester carboxylesterase
MAIFRFPAFLSPAAGNASRSAAKYKAAKDYQYGVKPIQCGSKMTGSKYPPPGKLIDLGGYRMHLLCRGEGSPTVVMDSAFGGFALDWSLVQPEIAKFTQVCAYDRSGYAWSEPNPKASIRTSQQLVHELHMLLKTAGISGPYVLVAHSFGGLNVRLFADQYPNDVVGMVLLDVAHEDAEERIKISHEAQVSRFNFLAKLARFGIVRTWLFPKMVISMIPEYKKLPPELRAAQVAVALNPKSFQTAAGEANLFPEYAAKLRAARSLGDMPLIVLTPVSSSPTWMELQKELAGLSTQGKLITVEGTGHYIQLGRPDVVVDAVRQVVEAARRRLTW